jgi:deoxyribodipyrimidine photo-lyase
MIQLGLFSTLEPTDSAWQYRLAAVDPSAYARTRNALDGRVTGLSPYITHGFTTAAEIYRKLNTLHHLDPMAKLTMELGWREYFHHVWSHLGEVMFANQRPPVWAGSYSRRLPADILAARTGVPVIDHAVSELYATGTLHNHARMWLASYIVHLRKVHWRPAAEWLYGHLLDGDLASNTLSWQWVAGTFSHKPYLFNAANVARYAPTAWHSPHTAIDTSYEHLAHIAHHAGDVGPEANTPAGIMPPPLLGEPPAGLVEALFCPAPELGVGWFRSRKALPVPRNNKIGVLLHPWSLQAHPGTPCIGVLHRPFHTRFPWSENRWRFVLTRMADLCELLWLGDLQAFEPGDYQLRGEASLNPGYREHLGKIVALQSPERFTANPSRLMPSFSQFWNAVKHNIG